VAAQCVAGTKGSAGGEFKDPEGVATDAAGNMWVAETNGQRIDKLDPSGKFLLALGKNVNLVAGATNFDVCTVAQSCQPATAGTRDGQFDRPRDIATDPAGDVYVADFLNGRVQKFDPTGRSFRCSAPVGPVSAATSYCRPASRPTHRAISTSPRKQATESRSSTPRAISCLQ
jgi:DNA-binding beta-propeller fold protein YncE